MNINYKIHFKKYLIYLSCALFIIPINATFAQIKKITPIAADQITIVATAQITPISISLFEPTFESPLSGQLYCPAFDSKIKEINLNISNKNQELVFSKKLDLEKLENSILPFALTEPILNGSYLFSIEAINQKEDIVAKTKQEFSLQSPQKHTPKTPNEIFKLAAKAVSIESQRQAALQRLEQQKLIAEQEKIREIKTEKSAFKNNIIDFIIIPLFSLFFVGIFAYFVRKKRRQNSNLTILFLAFLFIPQISFSQTPTAEFWQWAWEHPIVDWGFSTEDNDTGFNEMYISGEVVQGEIGLFGADGENLKNMRIRFEKDLDIFEYELKLKDLNNPTSSEFNIIVDLSQLDDLPDNEYAFNVLFQTDDDQWFMSDWGQAVKIDSTPPNLNFSYSPDGTGGNTNQDITVIVNCDDLNSGCTKTTYTGHKVYGNFCQDETICDTNKPSGYKVCDETMNCTDPGLLKNKVEITWFDNLPPSLDDFAIGIGAFFNNPNKLKAMDSFSAKISYEDKNEDDSITSHDHACGTPDGDFMLDASEQTCIEKTIPCVVNSTLRGTIDLTQASPTCNAICPSDYIPKDEYCVPKCNFLSFDEEGEMCLEFYVH